MPKPDIGQFKSAVSKLEQALAQPKNEFIRDSVIQRFEFSVELAWKTSKKIMGSTSTAPKTLVREMAQNKFINEVELWLKAVDMRNLSSHTYQEELAEEVYEFAKLFLPQLKQLLGTMEK
jgi:nucleotidyltransferase substrate binding protein (TIGR01987 family)